MIAPAFAANPWKDLYSCDGDVGVVYGTYDWVTGEPNNCNLLLGEDRIECDLKRGTVGHYEFKDINPYDGELSDGEQKRCHKNSFWV